MPSGVILRAARAGTPYAAIRDRGRSNVITTHRMCAAAAALSAFLFITLTCTPADAQERVVAKVNGKIITDADMKLAEAEIGNDLGTLPDVTKRRVLVEFLIENQLFADAAEKQSLGGSQNFEERIQYWRRRALRDVYFDRTVRETINEADVRKFYDTQVVSMQAEEEVRASHILVESKDKARELYEKVAHGSDFAVLAKEHSKDPGSRESGGELGFFMRGQMVPQFEEVAFKLNRGEVSQPFETQFGWHIVKIDERRRRAAAPFEKVKERVVATMIHTKAQEIVAHLRDKAQIEYIDPEIKRSIESDRAARPKP
jgi:peptidyl-prolyl cis-trans isomerase C